VPKSGDGRVEALRVLRVVRRSTVQNRTQAANQLRDLIVTAPSQLRETLTELNVDQRVRLCARFRPDGTSTPLAATKTALRSLARRHQALTADIDELEGQIRDLCAPVNPALLGALGVGPDVASALLVVAGGNPARLRSEASFASLCGSSPVEASSGRVTRHRLNRGGDRQANNAL
jgi:transposase